MGTAPTGPGFGRYWTFRPVLLWLVLSAALFGWRHHHTQAAKAAIRFDAALEDSRTVSFIQSFLDGQPYLAGTPSGLGSKTLRIEAPDDEPYTTNVFVWYGGLDLRDIRLPRSRGRLALDISPAARVRITGTARQDLENVTRQTIALPTGQYDVEIGFERFTLQHTVGIERDATGPVVIATNLVSLRLLSDPPGAEFVLALKERQPSRIRVNGFTPATLTGLPTGDYTLDIARGTYRKTLPVTLAATPATNEVTVVFEYASLAVESVPPGADVSGTEGALGSTPLTLTLPPGTHALRIAKPGYSSTNLTTTLAADERRTLSVQLVSLRYQEAMSAAARKMGLRSRNPQEILDLARTALVEQPGDPAAEAVRVRALSWIHLDRAKEHLRQLEFEAALTEVASARALTPKEADVTALQQDIAAARTRHEEEQRMALARAEEQRKQIEEQRRQAEAKAEQARQEERRQRPHQAFRKLAENHPHEALFEQLLLTYNEDIHSARSKILAGLQARPAWIISRSDWVHPEVCVIEARLAGFLTVTQHAFIAAGQTADGKVTVYMKLLVLGNQGSAGGGTLVPVHPRFFSNTPSMELELVVKRHTKTFLDRFNP